MTVSVVKGTALAGTAGVTVTWPASTGGVWVAGDWGVVVSGTKPETTASSIATFGTGGGTRNYASTNGAATGANVGDTSVTVRWAQLAGTEGGTTVVVTDTDDSVTWAQCYVLHSDVGWTTTVAKAWGKDDVSDTSYSAACSGDSSASYQTGDFIIAATTRQNTNLNWSAEAFAATGLTFDTIVEQQEFISTSGNNIGGLVTTGRVASGSASGGPTVTFSATAGSAVYGPTVLLGFREATTPQVDAAWSGSGVFTAAVVAVGVVTAAWTGSGAFTASTVEVEQTAAAWNGSGAFTAAAFEVYERDAAWNGSGVFSADVEADRQVNAAWDGSGAFTASVIPVGVVTADWPGTGSFTASVLPVEVVSAAWSGSGAWTADVESGNEVVANWQGSGAWSAVTSFTEIPHADTSNDDDGIWLGDGYAEVVWEPAVVAVPAHLALGEYRTVATVIDTAPTGHTPAVARSQHVEGAIDRVLIGDVDFTFYGGAAAVVENIKLIDPLLYGSASVTLPAINPQFPSALGDLYEYFRFARVRIQRVLDGVVVARDYKGFVSRIDTSGTELRLEVGGEAAGALSQLYVPPPVYRRKQDVEHILVDTMRDARVQAKEHAGDSGVGLIRRGGSDGLSIFNETLAVWAGSTGQPITFTPNANGVYRKTQKPAAEDPADFTCHPSDLVEISVSQDFTEQFTRVYAQGFTANGQLVANIKTPGLTQGDAPTLSGTLLPGDESDEVAALQEQLALHDFLDLDDVTPGLFDDETEAAVLRFKYEAGLADLTPAVGTPAWEALWDLASIGYSVDDAREYPTAQDIRTLKWFRTANGSKLSLNPDYDPHFKPNDAFFDAGGPFKKREIEAFAESKLVPTGGIWSGQIILRSGVVAGVHNPGDPFTTADVMDRRDVLPNMKAWLPYFNGGLTVYVSGVEHAGETTTLLVSSVPQTTMEVWAALERRREAKSNPGRAWSGHTRASQVRNDKGPQWDTSSGYIANKVALVAGWNEIKVPAGQAGIVQRIRAQLQVADEFACLLTQKPVSVAALNDNAATASPLVDPRPSARPWFERDAIVSWLKDRGYLAAWGTPAQPCGYDPSRKSDEFGATAQPITGLFVEEAGFNYETGVEPVLFLYVWVGADNHLLSGRVLRNQRTTDF